VPLAEEGWTEGEVPGLVVRRYLEPLARANIDTLVLGCTHYPLLYGVIAREIERTCGKPVPVVDSAEATADELVVMLETRALAVERSEAGQLRILVTDMPKRFGEVASRFLGRPVTGLRIEGIDL
jgi:glutamate racemase